MIFLRTSILLVCFINLASCKTQASRQNSENSNSQSSNATDANSADTNLTLGLFDDDERIYSFTPDFLDSARTQYQDQLATETPPGDFDETAFTTLLSLDLEYSAAQNLQKNLNADTTNSDGLGLVAIPTAIGVQKAAIRGVETARGIVWSIKGAINYAFKDAPTANYTKEYFEAEVQNKWTLSNNGQYSKFDPMSSITSKVKLVDASGNTVSPSKYLTESSQKMGANVYLGMLPNAKIFAALQAAIAKSHGGQPINILSMLESFETNYAFKMKSGADFSNIKNGQSQIKTNLKTGTGDQTLVISQWTQYSTADQTMMTSSVASSAIDSLLAGMKAGKPTYVHCKSGKGRSASVVVGARVALIIDSALDNGVVLDKKTIDALIDEQIGQVQSARDAVGISSAQKLNLQDVLYQRAGLKAAN